jgi:isopenicillin-N epimerase
MTPPPQTGHGRGRLADFGLDPGLLHANHGSYGAVPDALRDRQQQVRDDLRRSPCGFLRAEYPARIRQAAARVAAFLGGDPGDWVFVENATAAANAVIASVPLQPGDEILTTDQVYGAVRKAIDQRCRATGARRVEASIALPVSAPADILNAVLDAATDRTRLVILDHISSPCGLLFPVDDLCAQFRQRGVPVFVDGAHGPGNVDVDVTRIGADFYTGNAHKWLCAPHGAGVLWCDSARQPDLHPLVVSHGFGLGFTAEFDWPGTRDPSAWLTIPDAIDLHQAWGGQTLRQRNHDVAFAAAAALADELGTDLAAPRRMQTSMATLRLPLPRALPHDRIEALHIALERDHGVVVALNNAGGATWLRLSAAIYSDTGDLVEAGRIAWRALSALPNLD